MATAKMLGFIIGLIITIIVFGAIFGCVNKFLNPKCDLRAVDAFEAFNTLYTKCMTLNENKICKCGEFDINSLPPDYKILLTPFTKDNKESIRVSLVCNGRNAKYDYLENLEGNEKVRVYFPDPKNFEKVDNLAMLNLRRNMRDVIGNERSYWIYTTVGEKIRNENLFISDEILGDGFEIDGDLNYHYVKDVGLLLGVNNLVLVNYNGDVAFLARTISQGKQDLSFCNGEVYQKLTFDDYLNDDVVKNLISKYSKDEVVEVLNFYISINKPKNDVLYILRNYDFEYVKEIIFEIKILLNSDINKITENSIFFKDFIVGLINTRVKLGYSLEDINNPLFDIIDPLINLIKKYGDSIASENAVLVFEEIISNLEEGSLEENHPIFKILPVYLDQAKLVSFGKLIGLAKSGSITETHILYKSIEPLFYKIESEKSRHPFFLKDLQFAYPDFNPNILFKEVYLKSTESSKIKIIEFFLSLLNTEDAKLSDNAGIILYEINDENKEDSILDKKLNEFLDNKGLKEDTKEKIGIILRFSGEPIRIDYDYPSMDYKGTEYTIGGSHHINLDSDWYRKMVPEAVNHGIDPYFYIAFTILEFRGVSVNKEQIISPDPESQSLAKYQDLFIDFGYTLQSGAGGILFGDSKPILFSDDSLSEKIYGLQDIYGVFDQNFQNVFQAYNPKSPLNQQSFILLKYHYDNAMNNVDEDGLYSALQRIQGLGVLPRLFVKGEYPKDVTEREDKVEVTGKELSLYGKSMVELMKLLYNNPKIRELIPKDVATPLMDKVLE